MAIWLVTCSCGRTARLSSHWAAKPAAKLHERLAEGSGAVSSRTPGVRAQQIRFGILLAHHWSKRAPQEWAIQSR